MEIIIIALLAIVILLLILFRPKANNDSALITAKLENISLQLTQLNNNIREDFKNNRDESSKTAAENRKELGDNLNAFRQELTNTLRLITESNKTSAEQIGKTF